MITTFVLGDVVGSTRRWETAAAEMSEALAVLDDVVDAAAQAHGGERPLEQGEGDSFVVTFTDPSSALAFAIDIQRSDIALTLRMAVHSGEAERRRDGRWLGPVLNRAARLRALAAGGQVLVSGATAELAGNALPPHASLRDLGLHRLRDLTVAEPISQLCHPDLPADFPPLASLDRMPNNLPVELTSFVARDRELDDLVALLEAKRLVTLTGAGGCGKTRLAVEVGARVADRFPGGVWLADLASTADPGLVPHAVATALGLPEQAFQSMADTVVARLADERALMVLDNCEHLLDAVSELVGQLLHRCPEVIVMATSREALAVDGEHAYRVPSLDMPVDDDDLDCASVRLFVDRATAVRSSFTLDEETRSAVTALCRRLDGLPLALELAASRCRAMTPVEIAEQLDDRFRVLTAGRRSALARQRTLEASVRWSHDLLSEAERAVLRRLSVFPGGFSLAGAEEVGGFGAVGRAEVVDLLTSLVDKSLVHIADLDGRTRYRLLETIRMFAAERLEEAGELVEARDRHLAHMVAVAESSGFEDFGPPATDRFIELEIENLRSARDWGIERGHGPTVLRLLAATAAMWEQWSPREFLEVAPEAARLDGGTADDRMRLVFEVVDASLLTGDVTGARRAADEAARLAGEAGDERLVAVACYLDATVAGAEGDEQAIDTFDRAIGALRQLAVVPYLGFALLDSALSLTMADRSTEAADRIDEAITISNLGDGSTFVALADASRAMILPRTGRFEEAAASAARVLAGPVRLPVADVFALGASAWAASGRGTHEAAVELGERCLAEARRYVVVIGLLGAGAVCSLVRSRAGLHLDVSAMEELELLADLSGLPTIRPTFDQLRVADALARGDLPGAATLAARAEAAADASPFAAVEWAGTRRAAAAVALASGDLVAAEDKALAALLRSAEVGNLAVAAEAIETLAQVAAALERDAEAARLLGAAEVVRLRIGWCRSRAEDVRVVDVARRLESALGREDLAAQLDAGRSMRLDDVVAFASRGRGERKRPSFGWESLTPTERDVVELVGQGLRNKDVADKLLMSPATVKTHLTHVFAKLGMSRRGQLIAAVADRRTSRSDAGQLLAGGRPS